LLELTIFAIPKEFSSHSAIIQVNALSSWSRLPGAEVIVLGDDDGVAEAAHRFGMRHIPAISRSAMGTPLLDDAFKIARESAQSPVLCYVNADVMLFDDLVRAVASLRLPQYLAVGQRWNLDVTENLSLDDPVTEREFQRRARTDGELEPPWGSDYFVFPRTVDWGLPSFAVGRPRWDNWLIQRARDLHVPVVDISPDVTAIHQNHDYGHVPSGGGESYEGPEATLNRELAGADALADLDDATHVMHGGQIVRARGWRYTRKRLLNAQQQNPVLRGPVGAARWIFQSVKRS
jgi:hypothetical protein